MKRLLRKQIAEFLSSIPHTHTEPGRRAMIVEAALDEKLQQNVTFSGPTAQFCQLLISVLTRYGKLEDGRDPLESVLEAAKQHVGKEKREYCDTIVQEWRAFRRQRAVSESVAQGSEDPGETRTELARMYQIYGPEEMDYTYDVFLSYRDDFVGPWVRRYFLPLFDWHLEASLGRSPGVFKGRQGTSVDDVWPLRLRIALAHSRCLVAICSPSYFQSPWSMQECTTMLDRAVQLGYQHTGRLILPVVVSDGKHFPEFVKNVLHQFDCRSFAIPALAFEKTERYIEFRDKMEEWVEDVVTETIRRAPPWREAWLSDPGMSIPETRQAKCEFPTL